MKSVYLRVEIISGEFIELALNYTLTALSFKSSGFSPCILFA
mgnify:FL=1|jgi:hypothetical protein